MAIVTLLFPSYEVAVAAAQQLGFWQEPQPIYDYVETGETVTHYHYVDTETGEPRSFNYLPEGNALIEEGILVPADPATTEEPVLNWQEVGMDEGRVKSSGQSIGENGVVFGWCIDEIGLNPIVVNGEYDEEGNILVAPKKLKGYAVNATGDIPEAAMVYAIPYGSAGRIFAGNPPANFIYVDIEGKEGYVEAVEI